MRNLALLTLLLLLSPFFSPLYAPAYAQEEKYPSYLKTGYWFYYAPKKHVVGNITAQSTTYYYEFEHYFEFIYVNTTTEELRLIWRKTIYENETVIYNKTCLVMTLVSSGYIFFVLPEDMLTSKLYNNLCQFASMFYYEDMANVTYYAVNYTIEAYNMTVRAYNITIVEKVPNGNGTAYINAIVWDNGLVLEVNAHLEMDRPLYGYTNATLRTQSTCISEFSLVLKKSNFLDELVNKEKENETEPEPVPEENQTLEEPEQHEGSIAFYLLLIFLIIVAVVVFIREWRRAD